MSLTNPFTINFGCGGQFIIQALDPSTITYNEDTITLWLKKASTILKKSEDIFYKNVGIYLL